MAEGANGLVPEKPIKQQHVDYWIRVMKKLPSEHARAAERVAEGRFTRYDFRPDIFGPPDPGAALAQPA